MEAVALMQRLEVDHKLAVARGGTKARENLRHISLNAIVASARMRSNPSFKWTRYGARLHGPVNTNVLRCEPPMIEA
jgi:hypothetical protein